MNTEIISLLEKINIKLDEQINNQAELKECLGSILVAIYDLDIPQMETDNSDVIRRLDDVLKLLKKVLNNQSSVKNHVVI